MINTTAQQSKNEIVQRISDIRKRINDAQADSPHGQAVTLMAVTKTVDADRINAAIEQGGIRCIGENRVQELCEKYPYLHLDGVSVHLIGTLQSNKVKYIIDKVDMIQSLDSLSLAKEIDRQAKKHSKVMNVLCQINIGREESKSGVDPDKVEEFLLSIKDLTSIKVQGLMAIPPICEDFSVQKQYFQKIMQIFIDIKGKNMDNINMHILSFGMSGDYCQAIECGANMIRPGTALFGKRDYNKEN